MSAGRHPRPAPLLLTNPEIPDVLVHPVPGTVLKIPGAPDQRAILTDNQAKMRSLIILDKDILVLCGNGFSLFAGKGAVRQPLKYSEISHPLLRQWLMHQDQLCQTVAPLQPRKTHLTSAQDALQRVNLQ